MRTLIKNCILVCDGETELHGSILVEEGKIKQILSETDPLLEVNHVIDAEGNYLIPGLIDIHLHGSYGYDFIRDPKQSIDEVSKGLVSEGTTSFMASLTVISHTELCDLLKEYSTITSSKNAANFLGIHSEGPYLSLEYKALMDPRWLRDPDITELNEMVDAAKGTLKIMTIAPERAGMDQFIQEAIQRDITLMIGHTGCTSQEAQKALNFGVTGFTHLYNAMTQHLHRTPGAVTAALLNPQAYAELIVDGFHIHPDTIRATWKMLGPKQIVLITDAMLGKGMPDGDYTFSNLDCRKTSNTVQVKATGRIAGSAITMLDALRNMKTFCHCSMKELVQMACVNPAIVAKVYDKKGSLAENKDADFILIDSEFNLLRTFIQGKEVYQC